MFKQVFNRSLKLAANANQIATRNLTTRVTMIPGDGIGPEVMEATKEVVAAVQAPIEFDEHPVSEIQGYTPTQLEECLASIRQNKVVLQGFVLASTKQKSKLNLQMMIRRELDIFANVSHVKSYDGIDTRYKNLDFIIFRETTEGEYCGEEHESVPVVWGLGF